MSTWCNKLGSTPVIGLKLDWLFTSGNKILDCLSPIIATMNKDDNPAFGIDILDAFNLTFTTNDGFQYSVTPNRIAVAFTHRVQIRHIAGGSPALDMLSSTKKYTDLLDSAIEKLFDAALLLPGKREITKIGVVTNTLADEADFPPGITKFVKYFGRPWGGAMDAYHFQATSLLKETSKTSDRCIHKITKSELADTVPALNFDFQRTFLVPLALHRKTLKDNLVATSESAIGYFEELADGSMFDDEILSSNNRA